MNRIWRIGLLVAATLAAACSKEKTSQGDLSALDQAAVGDLTLAAADLPTADLPDQAAPDLAVSDLTPLSDFANPPPYVSYISPGDGASYVSYTPTIYVSFSAPMDTAATTISLSSATLGTVSWAAGDTVASVAPTAALTPAASYTISISGKSKAGTSLAGALSATFSTSPAPDTTPPTVIGHTPATSATGVAITAQPTFTFSEPIDPKTLVIATNPATSFTSSLDATGTIATYQVGNVRCTAPPTSIVCKFAPTALRPFVDYQITVAAKDLVGNALTGTVTFPFQTGADPDYDVRSFSPANATSGVAIDKGVTKPSITFTKAMKPSSVVITKDTVSASDNVLVEDAGTDGSANNQITISSWFWSNSDTTLNITMTNNFVAGHYYNVYVTNTLQDSTGTAIKLGKQPIILGGGYNPSTLVEWSTAADTTAPTVLSATLPKRNVGTVGGSTVGDTDATSNPTAIDVNGPLVVTFSEPMDHASTQSAVSFKQGINIISSLYFGWTTSNGHDVLTVWAPYISYGAAHTLTLDHTKVKDLAGNALAADATYTFTTINLKTVTLAPTLANTVYEAPNTLPADGMSISQHPFWVGERNQFQNAQDGTIAAVCAILTGGIDPSCAAGVTSSTVVYKHEARGVLDFTLPSELASAAHNFGVDYARLVLRDTKPTGTPMALGPYAQSIVAASDLLKSNDAWKDSLYTQSSDLPGGKAMISGTGTLLWTVVTSKVLADCTRAVAQSNHSQFRVLTGIPADADNEDDNLYVATPQLEVSYLTPDP